MNNNALAIMIDMAAAILKLREIEWENSKAKAATDEELAKAYDDISKKDGEIKALTIRAAMASDEITVQMEHIQKIERDLSMARRELVDCFNVIKQKEEGNNGHLEFIKDQATKITELMNHYDSSNEKIKDLMESIERGRSTNDQHVMAINSLKSQNNALLATIDDRDNKIERLELALIADN